MAHNVQPTFPNTGSQIFTVVDDAFGVNTMKIMVRQRGTNSGAAPGLVLAPWTDHRVDVVGEDLYALRELLAELPEEAFVRPVDPVTESICMMDDTGHWWILVDDVWLNNYADSRHFPLRTFSVGEYKYQGFDAWQGIAENHGIDPGKPEESYCLIDGDGDWWSYVDGYWVCGRFRGSSAFAGLDSLDGIIKRYGIDSGEPEVGPWIDGDIVYFKGYRLEGYLVRRNGEWVSFGVLQYGSPYHRAAFRDLSDEKVDEYLGRSNWGVVIRGGVRQP